MTIKTYKFMTRTDYALTCWICGEEVEEATLIEWNRSFEKEIVCDACLGEIVRNEKNFKILGDFHK